MLLWDWQASKSRTTAISTEPTLLLLCLPPKNTVIVLALLPAFLIHCTSAPTLPKTPLSPRRWHGCQVVSKGLPASRMRFVALSATLPNAADFGVFLRAEVFRFGAEYRPVQLHVRFWWIRLGTFCQLGFTSPAFRKVLLWAASEEINSHIYFPNPGRHWTRLLVAAYPLWSCLTFYISRPHQKEHADASLVLWESLTV